MSMSDYLQTTHELDGLEARIYQDPDPSHPDEGSDDVFLVSFDRNFWVVRKNTWDEVSDFRDFIHPRFQVDGWDRDEDLPEPAAKPEDGPADPRWREVYMAHCTDQMEVLLLAAGEDTPFTNPEGRAAAGAHWDFQMNVWEAWQRFKAAHADWACFTLDVRYYGGGCVSISLGEIYDGSETDRWGDPKEPHGFVMVKKSAGWKHTMQEVAESIVKEWSHYLDGEVYGYDIVDEDGDSLDSCWGFIGDMEDCEKEALSTLQYFADKRRKQMLLFPTGPSGPQKEVTDGG